jgi:transcriptional regulator with XRE-family HTH domain
MGKLRTLGETVRYWRTETGMSLREAAEEADISHAYLSLIERDETPPPSEEIIARLEFALGAPPYEFLRISGRVPKDIIKILQRRPLMVDVVRALEDEEDDALRRLIDGTS